MKKAFNKMKVETLKANSELVQNHEEICCAICIDNFEAGSVVRHLTCTHVYHKKVDRLFLWETNGHLVHRSLVG